MVHYMCGVCFCSGGREYRESLFISGGFNKWKRAIHRSKENSCFNQHAMNVHYREAAVRIMGFLNNRRPPGTDIQSKIAKKLAN